MGVLEVTRKKEVDLRHIKGKVRFLTGGEKKLGGGT
jgi:hypothetical protein